MEAQTPILLDTDIGSDIDDAVALAYLLRQPRCELLGITTVSGSVHQRAACAQVICRAAGREDVPIHAGAPGPLLWGPGQPDVPQYQAIRELPHRQDWPAGTAIEFLRQTIRSRPGEITLLTIGPLTNAALLFALDPEIPSLLKEMVSMAGIFFRPGAEWNCLVDPVAAAMVYQAPVRRHVSFGLDVTMKCRLPVEEVRDRFRKPPLGVVLKMAEVWFTHSREITFHDPLAAAAIFQPGICTQAPGRVRVEVSPKHFHGGRTEFERSDSGPHLAAETVRPEAFFSEFFSVFE